MAVLQATLQQDCYMYYIYNCSRWQLWVIGRVVGLHTYRPYVPPVIRKNYMAS